MRLWISADLQQTQFRVQRIDIVKTLISHLAEMRWLEKNFVKILSHEIHAWLQFGKMNVEMKREEQPLATSLIKFVVVNNN